MNSAPAETTAPNAVAEIPSVPLTVEGASTLHQMLRVKWAAWKALPAAEKSRVAGEAARALAGVEETGQSALYSLIGHKGDLMLLHFRPDFEQLNRTELDLARLSLWDYVEPTHSYLSMIELGLYDSTVKLYTQLAERGLTPYSPEWDREVAEMLDRQKEAMKPRLWPEIPKSKYICFYPMDRKRGEEINFYRVSMADRQRMMREHGMVGRRYAGEVKQIITGSIGFDDWEWGVDLFGEDPLVFKKLIYEMRFDEVSAVYALFGAFYIGVRRPAEELPALLGA